MTASLSAPARADSPRVSLDTLVASLVPAFDHADVGRPVGPVFLDEAFHGPSLAPPPVTHPASSPRVALPPRPESTFASFAISLPVPLIRQIGDKSNCGPTAAAMVLGAYEGLMTPAALRDLRNALGEWTWQRFPRRQGRQLGSDSGGTTRLMMQQSLDRFGDSRWTPVAHAWLPREVWSLVALKRHLAERRPLVVLAEAGPLWGSAGGGLHWVVATGFLNGRVLIHDPADGRVNAVPLGRFWRAWRLPEQFRPVAGISGFEALVADRSLPAVPIAIPRERHVAHEALLAY